MISATTSENPRKMSRTCEEPSNSATFEGNGECSYPELLVLEVWRARTFSLFISNFRTAG